jgi:hypothetical protein
MEKLNDLPQQYRLISLSDRLYTTMERITVRETIKGQSRMDNPKTLTTIDT